MSSKAYREAYSSMTEKQKDIMYDLCMKAVSHDGHMWNMYCDIEDAVAGIVKEQMPPAQPGWIPWDSGKFPEESGTYTVTAYDGATKRVTYAKYQKRLKRWELTGARAYWRVLAWMPHIEPWEGERDE